MNINDYLSDHIECVKLLPVAQLEKIAQRVISCLSMGGTVYTCGNGGSASDAMHLTAELVGRFEDHKRPPLRSICLNADVTTLTALANDYGYVAAFCRPLELSTPRDVLIGFTTSGRSLNVLNALDTAKKIGAATVCFTSINADRDLDEVDYLLKIESRRTSHIQECHIIAIHLLAKMVEDEISKQ